MIGRTLSHFRITAKLGEGGMGVVYRAEDTRLRRPVALKVLPPELVASEERRLRFLREARAAAAVSHPNIATIYDVGEAEGIVFIAMELVEGKTLRALIGGRPLPIKEALRVAAEMAEGMAAAHEAKVVHRDLKPDNVVVAASRHVKILDFGLAKLLQGPRELGADDLSQLQTISGEMTREGKIFGTVSYMSPEQARGQPVDSRSDLFSFGTTLYEMVTGRVPFEGKTATDVLSAIVRDEPVPAARLNPEVPAELERIIAGCLEKNLEDRYQHTDQLAVDLRKLRRVTDSGVQVARAPGELASRPGRPRMAGRALAIGAALAAAMALLIGGWLFTRRPERTRDLRLKQLTANPTENPLEDAAISPDGKYLAFADRDGVQLLLVETGEVHSILLSEKFIFGELGWFPDSTRLITTGGAWPGLSGGLWVFPVIGGTPRRLRDDVWGGTVSPDGSLIAFLTGGWPAREIWLMGPSGEQPKRIVQAEEGDVFFWVIWSPDGGRIAYGRMHSGLDRSFNAIESRQRGGGPASTIVSDSRLSMNWHGLLRPVWLTDGRLIFPLAESPPRESDSNLWQIRADPRTGEPSGDPERLTDWPDYSARQLSATRDGSRIAFLKVRQQTDIYLGELLEEGNRIGAVRQLTVDERTDDAESWTPDGRAVLFSSNRRGSWDIFKQRIEEAIPEPVVATPSDEWGSEPSPDGRFTLYWSSPDPDEAPGTRPLMRVPLSGGAPERVLNVGEADQFACPRLPQKPCVLSGVKGAELAFSVFDPVEPKPVEVTRVAINPARFHDWALSPDGSRIAIVNFDDHVRVVSLEGGPVRDFKVEGWSLLESLSWSPGGNSLYIDGSWGRGKGIIKLDLDGRVHPLLQRENQWFMFPVPSPDGRYLAYSAMITQSNAWMVEGF